jgi:hypoxanthine phosphoribosyltransferase
MKDLILDDLGFELFIANENILSRVKEIAKEIDEFYINKEFVIICTLKGAFRFFSDLSFFMKSDPKVLFTKPSSYLGLKSSDIKLDLELNIEDVENKHILIIEDIIETGKTMQLLIQDLSKKDVKTFKIASLLTKPQILSNVLGIDYVGFEISNRFVVGYGLDYNELGRNLNDLYQLKD